MSAAKDAMNQNSKVFKWFNLDNYEEAEDFSAGEWAVELRERKLYFGVLFDPEVKFSSQEQKLRFQNAAVEFFSNIKRYGLASRFLTPGKLKNSNHRFDEFYCSFGGIKTSKSSVQNLSIETAFLLFRYSSNYEEIVDEIDEHDDLYPSENIGRRAQIRAKYSHPLSTLDPDGEDRYIQLNMAASDEQLKRDFAIWLNLARRQSSYQPPKKLFSPADFLDWHNARILPFFDLQACARIADLSSPLHVLANALFPDDLEVDVVERVRKVTKRKANWLFSDDVILALEMQGEADARG